MLVLVPSELGQKEAQTLTWRCVGVEGWPHIGAELLCDQATPMVRVIGVALVHVDPANSHKCAAGLGLALVDTHLVVGPMP